MFYLHFIYGVRNPFHLYGELNNDYSIELKVLNKVTLPLTGVC